MGSRIKSTKIANCLLARGADAVVGCVCRSSVQLHIAERAASLCFRGSCRWRFGCWRLLLLLHRDGSGGFLGLGRWSVRSTVGIRRRPVRRERGVGWRAEAKVQRGTWLRVYRRLGWRNSRLLVRDEIGSWTQEWRSKAEHLRSGSGRFCRFFQPSKTSKQLPSHWLLLLCLRLGLRWFHQAPKPTEQFPCDGLAALWRRRRRFGVS